jgi:hypothetical protein
MPTVRPRVAAALPWCLPAGDVLSPLVLAGNQMPLEEYRRLRKLKLLRWAVGFVVVVLVR